MLNGIAREFGVFDHWFCEVPSQTFMNRSFWTAATSSGFVVNSPMSKWLTKNDAETIFDRLEAHGRTWKVYVMEPMPVSFTGVIHFPRLKGPAGHALRAFADFEKDAAAGTLPDFSLIEPNMLSGHGDYHPAFGRSFSAAVDIAMDSPSSMLSGEAFLARVFAAYRSATSETGVNVWNTALLIGWDEPGGTYDHVPPPPVPPPDPAAPPGEFGFTFDRSGYRVPAVIVSPWVEPGSVYNEEYRHTSLIATLRKMWGLGPAVHRAGRRGAHVRARLLAGHTPRPADLGTQRSASGARMDVGPRADRPGPEQPGRGPGTCVCRDGQTDGGAVAGRTQRPRGSPTAGASRRCSQGHRRPFLPAADRRRERPPAESEPCPAASLARYTAPSCAVQIEIGNVTRSRKLGLLLLRAPTGPDQGAPVNTWVRGWESKGRRGNGRQRFAWTMWTREEPL